MTDMETNAEDIQTITTGVNDIADFTIRVGGQTLKVHKSILIASSDYFRGLFGSQMIESRTNQTELDSDWEPFVRIMKFTYKALTDEEWSSLTIEELMQSIITANKYQFNECERIMSQQIVLYLEKPLIKPFYCRCIGKKATSQDTQDMTVWDVLQMAKPYNLQALYDMCLKLCDRYVQYVYETSKTRVIDKAVLMDVLLRPTFDKDGRYVLNIYDQWADKNGNANKYLRQKVVNRGSERTRPDMADNCQLSDDISYFEKESLKDWNSQNPVFAPTMPYILAQVENCGSLSVKPRGAQEMAKFVSVVNVNLFQAHQRPSDMALKIDGRFLRVHKSILTSSSNFFRNLLSNNRINEWHSSDTSIVKLAIVMCVCYRVNITEKQWRTVNGTEMIEYIKTAKMFQFVDVERQLSKKLVDRYKCSDSQLKYSIVNTVWQLLEQAKLSELDYLYELGLEFMHKNPLYLINTFHNQLISETVMIDGLIRQTPEPRLVWKLFKEWLETHRDLLELTADREQQIKAKMKNKWPEMSDEPIYFRAPNRLDRELIVVQNRCKQCYQTNRLAVRDVWPNDTYFSMFDSFTNDKFYANI